MPALITCTAMLGCSAEFRSETEQKSLAKPISSDMDAIASEGDQPTPIREVEDLTSESIFPAELGVIEDQDQSDTLFTQTISVLEESYPINIIMAIDTSLSMRDEREQLEQNLPIFIASLKKRDLNVSLTLLAEPDEFNTGEMNELLTIHPTEISSHDAISQLSFYTENLAPQEEYASLHYVFISDDNAKGEENAATSLYLPPAKEFKSHAIVGLRDHDHQDDCDIAEKGQTYIDLAMQTKGAVLDVCSKDWNALLLNLADSIQASIIREYELAEQFSNAELMHVFLNDLELKPLEADDDESTGYRISEGKLIISSSTELSLGDQIMVYYRR